MARDEREMEIVKKAFEFGMNYILIKQGKMVSGTFPENLEDALEFSYQYLLDNNIDKECLKCGRYENRSCMGTVDRQREVITQGNRCAAFYERKND